MNLHAVVRGPINAINPDVPATLFASTGWTTQPDGTRVPAYGPAVQMMAQVQALSWKDLQMLDGVNIAGEARAIYLYGDWRSVIRPEKAGGDLIVVEGAKWLIVKALETWAVGWSKVAAVRQMAC